ncbi:carbohydrate-binding protein, partial [Seonamhaeicola marinus]
MNIKIFYYSIFIAFNCVYTFAQNPIIKDIGMSDPHVRVFNDTIYLFTGHDSSPEDKTWKMPDWKVYKTTNLTDWTLINTISPKNNYMNDNSLDCWAGDGANRNGKYYFYFSDKKRGIGVMTANTMYDDFNDALGKPLVSPMHDPTILINDDEANTPYIVYGEKHGGGYHVAQLNDDMISLAETPKPIQIIGKEWEDTPEWMDKNYIFKFKDTYYLSWGKNYAVSKNIYGPYKTVGSVGEGHDLGELAHGSFFWWKGQFYHIWCYYIRPGYRYRESIISYCHFDEKNQIVTDTRFLDSHFNYGVARYNTSWEKIESEWFYGKSDNLEKSHYINKDFVITNFKNKSWLQFTKVKFEGAEKYFSVKFENNIKKGKVDIRLGSQKGELLGRINLSKHNAKTRNQNTVYTGDLNKIITGEQDIYLVFKNLDTSAKLNW